MQIIRPLLVFTLSLLTLNINAQQSKRIVLGQIKYGQTVSFVKTSDGTWGMEISGGASTKLFQAKPAHVEVYQGKAKLCPKTNMAQCHFELACGRQAK